MSRVTALPLVLIVLVVAVPAAGTAATPTESATVSSPHEAVENPDGNITVLRGAGPLYESLDTHGEFATARDAGQVRRPQFLAPGDLLGLQFESTRVTETYAATNGPNSTDRFFDVLESTETNFSVLGLNHGPEQIPSKFDLNRSNVKVLHDADTDTFSVLVDTANVSVVDRRNGDSLRQTLEHREFQAILEIPAENETRTLAGSSRFRGIGASLETPMEDESIEGYLTPTISEHATENLTLTGSTPFLPDTSLTVRASASDGSTLATRNVSTTNANKSTAGFGRSTFETTLELVDLDANDTVEIAVVKDGAVLAERTLLVGQQAKMTNTSARLVTSGVHEGEIVVTATLRLPEPGLLLVYVDGEAQSVTVPEHQTVERTLYVGPDAVDEPGEVYPVVVWDRNENGVHDPDVDPLYSSTLDVGASAQDRELDAAIRVAGWPPDTTTATSTTREQPTTDERTTRGPTTTESTTTESTSTGIPGFGPLMAVLGIGLAALLAVRSASE